MLRRQARLRREFLYRKTKEDQHKQLQQNKRKVERCLDENVRLPVNLRSDTLELQRKLEWEDAGPEMAVQLGGESGGALANSQDDEYRYAGVEDPKIMLTTSHDPNASLRRFVKEVRLIFPNAQRLNRGKMPMKQLVDICRNAGCTDLIIIHQVRDGPSQLIVSHLPYGPTAHFQITDVVMRHDIPDIGPVSEQYPHLVFHNFKTKLGERVMSILKYLFPVPKEDSKRVISFSNHDDYISFRQHTYRKIEGQVDLSEVGPRFQLHLLKIDLGTLENLNSCETEWTKRSYTNTAYKKRYLSEDDGFA